MQNKRAGLSPLMAGLTIVAFGTSSPELVVSVKAALSNLGDISVGNVVGSNSFNIGVILGLTTSVCPIPLLSTGGCFTGLKRRHSLPFAVPIFSSSGQMSCRTESPSGS